MLSLIYVSSVGPAFHEAHLGPLVEEAARINGGNAITGLLAYNGVHFMQLLEGPAERVDETMARIAADPRHTGLVVIRRDERERRECPVWSMRSFLTPLAGAGAATRFAASLPVDFAADTRVIFTSFASLPRVAA
jgi:hypothetical protein